ncbi:hypothetical protein CYLTODRAFT_238143, partial [Cylindrobasidium torrendii FP15055 ss-10]
LQRGISIIVGIISGTACALYLLSIVVAVIDVQSPYRTTFSDILSTILRRTFPFFYNQKEDEDEDTAVRPSVKLAERAAAIAEYNEDLHPLASQACNALVWVTTVTDSESAKSLVRQAIGAFPSGFFQRYNLDDLRSPYAFREQEFRQLFDYNDDLMHYLRKGVVQEAESNHPLHRDRAERHLRALAFHPDRRDFDFAFISFDDTADPEMLAVNAQATLSDYLGGRNELECTEEDHRAIMALENCGFDVHLAMFMLTRCQYLNHPDATVHGMSCVLDELPWLSAATWGLILVDGFAFLSPEDVADDQRDQLAELDQYPRMPRENVDISGLGYLGVVYWVASQSRSRVTFPLGDPIPLWHFLRPIFQELGWFSTSSTRFEGIYGYVDTLYHPLLQKHYPEVEDIPCRAYLRNKTLFRGGIWEHIKALCGRKGVKNDEEMPLTQLGSQDAQEAKWADDLDAAESETESFFVGTMQVAAKHTPLG